MLQLIFSLFSKQPILMRRSTVPSLSLRWGFPDWVFVLSWLVDPVPLFWWKWRLKLVSPSENNRSCCVFTNILKNNFFVTFCKIPHILSSIMWIQVSCAPEFHNDFWQLILFFKNNFTSIKHCKFIYHRSHLKPFISYLPCIRKDCFQVKSNLLTAFRFTTHMNIMILN